jgi:hypothetical protein
MMTYDRWLDLLRSHAEWVHGLTIGDLEAKGVPLKDYWDAGIKPGEVISQAKEDGYL